MSKFSCLEHCLEHLCWLLLSIQDINLEIWMTFTYNSLNNMSTRDFHVLLHENKKIKIRNKKTSKQTHLQPN